MCPDFRVHPDADAVAEAGAQRIAALARAAAAERGWFSMALAGGTTPGRLYRLLATDRFREAVPWASCHVFWGDERFVPPDSPQSNYRLAEDNLLRHVPLPPAHIHRVPTELTPEAAATTYSRALAAVLGAKGLDIVLLGMGEDGHVASLFPGGVALSDQRRGAVAHFVPQLDAWRLTLTLTEINHARSVIFVVTGANKAQAISDVSAARMGLPAVRVRPAGGSVTWLIDESAARLLSRSAEGHGTVDSPTGDDMAALKRAAGESAASLVASGMWVGLGTGSTAHFATAAIGRRLARGELHDIVAIPSSDATALLARQKGIPLATLDERPELDLAIDGADEVTPELDLIKGLGGALLREKIIATAAARFVVIADASKRVNRLGTRAPLPVAVVPFGWRRHLAPLRRLGAEPVLRRQDGGQPVVTDDGLYLLDCRFDAGIDDPAALERAIIEQPGVVDTGLFVEMATEAHLAGVDGVSILRR